MTLTQVLVVRVVGTTPKKKAKIWYQQAFKSEWMDEPEFKKWLKRDSDRVFHAIAGKRQIGLL